MLYRKIIAAYLEISRLTWVGSIEVKLQRVQTELWACLNAFSVISSMFWDGNPTVHPRFLWHFHISSGVSQDSASCVMGSNISVAFNARSPRRDRRSWRPKRTTWPRGERGREWSADSEKPAEGKETTELCVPGSRQWKGFIQSSSLHLSRVKIAGMNTHASSKRHNLFNIFQ